MPSSRLGGWKWGENLTLLSQSHSVYSESFPRLPSQGNLCPPLPSRLPAVFSKWQVFPSSGKQRAHHRGWGRREKPASLSWPWVTQPWKAGHWDVRAQEGEANSRRKNKTKSKQSRVVPPQWLRDGFGRDHREPLWAQVPLPMDIAGRVWIQFTGMDPSWPWSGRTHVQSRRNFHSVPGQPWEKVPPISCAAMCPSR